MSRPSIATLASGLLYVGLVYAEVAPPSRGVTTCASSMGCGWQMGKAVQGRTVGAEPIKVPATVKDQVKTSSAQAVHKRGRPNHKRGRPNNDGGGVVAPWDTGPGNLPIYLAGTRHTPGSDISEVVIVPEKQTGALLAGLRAGDILPAEIEQSIKASSSVATPIRARVTAGRFRGAFVLGNATLDRELKRVLFTFERLRVPGNDTSYQLRASGLALSGQVGLEGDFHTQEGTYFVAELGAAAAAGYADATTSRTQTLTGGYVTEPSAANAARQGAVAALSKSAERFADRARTAPEYTEIEGGRSIQIIIEQSPTEANLQ